MRDDSRKWALLFLVIGLESAVGMILQVSLFNRVHNMYVPL